ncbi:unnamed protein product [Phytophthora lilii]|uniref:Unnamed protein product n=1 Tax=Phytophthora lilii TaxID=2077276 RepID=A0A9W6TFB2_9STRA|nr:unnamed protein product [Phytophthora lilii]
MGFSSFVKLPALPDRAWLRHESTDTTATVKTSTPQQIISAICHVLRPLSLLVAAYVKAIHHEGISNRFSLKPSCLGVSHSHLFDVALPAVSPALPLVEPELLEVLVVFEELPVSEIADDEREVELDEVPEVAAGDVVGASPVVDLDDVLDLVEVALVELEVVDVELLESDENVQSPQSVPYVQVPSLLMA